MTARTNKLFIATVTGFNSPPLQPICATVDQLKADKHELSTRQASYIVTN